MTLRESVGKSLPGFEVQLGKKDLPALGGTREDAQQLMNIAYQEYRNLYDMALKYINEAQTNKEKAKEDYPTGWQMNEVAKRIKGVDGDLTDEELKGILDEINKETISTAEWGLWIDKNL